MTNKKRTIKELKEALDSLDITNKYRLNLIRAIEYLQGEPVSEDLDKAIDTYLATYFGGEKEKQDWPFLKKMAIHFANWQKRQTVNKACKWLDENLEKYIGADGECNIDWNFINDFKKRLEE